MLNHTGPDRGLILESYINDGLLNLKQVQGYVKERLEMEGVSREEYLAALPPTQEQRLLQGCIQLLPTTKHSVSTRLTGHMMGSTCV
jgi:hypothetical protein